MLLVGLFIEVFEIVDLRQSLQNTVSTGEGASKQWSTPYIW